MKQSLDSKIVTKDGRVYVGDITKPAAPGLLTLNNCSRVEPGGWECNQVRRSIPVSDVLDILHGAVNWGMEQRTWFDENGTPVII